MTTPTLVRPTRIDLVIDPQQEPVVFLEQAAGRIVGRMRVDLSKGGRLASVTELFLSGEAVEPEATRAGLSRLARRKEERAARHQVTLSLFRQLYRFSVARELSYWQISMSWRDAGPLAALGLPLTRLHEPDETGQARYVVATGQIADRLNRRNPELTAWMLGVDSHVA